MAYLHLLLGLAGLLLGSDLAVRGSIALALRWGWPSWVTGLLLLALGTSLPELFVCMTSAPHFPGLAVGNIFGSNAFNVGVVLGLALMLKSSARLQVHLVRLPTLLPLLFGSLVLFALPSMPLARYRYSFLFLLAYLLMILFSIATREVKDSAEDIPVRKPCWNLGQALGVTAGGFLLLALCSDWFLQGALSVADEFGWKEGFAGFIITAIGTSAPELFTSIRALRLGHAEAVFGNIVGSNAFNLLVAGGAVGAIAQVPVAEESLSSQLVVNLAATGVLLLPTLSRRIIPAPSVSLCRVFGALLVLGYIVAALWIS